MREEIYERERERRKSGIPSVLTSYSLTLLLYLLPAFFFLSPWKKNTHNSRELSSPLQKKLVFLRKSERYSSFLVCSFREEEKVKLKIRKKRKKGKGGGVGCEDLKMEDV